MRDSQILPKFLPFITNTHDIILQSNLNIIIILDFIFLKAINSNVV